MSTFKTVKRLSLLVSAVFLIQSHIFASLVDVVGSTTEPPKFDTWSVVGPAGGDVRVVTIDPKDKDRLYISTLDGQIYSSVDAGKQWRLLVNLNQPELILDNLLVDSRDSQIIFASGHRHKAPGGFFRTTDGGLTWKEAKELKDEAIHSMTQSDFDPNIIWIGTPTGAWISKNTGADWEKVASSTMPGDIDSIAIDPRNTSTIYAGTWWRPYKTTDSGKNWKLIKEGMIDDSDVFAVNIDPRNPEHIIASACSGIYETVNAGGRWSKIQGIPSQSRRTRDILQHPTIAGTIYAATTEGFWMSTNGGKSWILTTQRNLEINSIAVHPDQPNRVFIATNNYGVMVSNDGGRNFLPTNDNFTSRLTYSITPDNHDPNRLYAATHNVGTGGGFFFYSADAGANWKSSNSIDVNRISPFAFLQDRTDPNLLYLGTNIGIYRSLDRGVTWTLLAAPKPPVAPKKPIRKASKQPIRKITVAVKKPIETTTPLVAGPIPIVAINEKVKVLAFTEDGRNGIFAGTDKGLYRSYDLTKDWEKIDLGPGVNNNIFAVHIAPAHPDTIWVGTATSGVVVSRDAGKTWTRTGGAVDSVPVSSIQSDPKRPDYIYVGTSQTFYLSRDAGSTWDRKGGNLPLGNFTSILINPDNTDEVIVSSSLETDGGVFISTDAGKKWKRIDGKEMKLPSRRVWTMAFDPTDPNRIYAGTHSSGVYRIERKPVAAIASPVDRPRTVGNN